MNADKKNLEGRLKAYAGEFAPVVPFVPSDKLLIMDFTANTKELTDEVINDTNKFIVYINKKLKDAGAKYGIGGYGENRTIYRRSNVFGPSPITGTILQYGAKAPSRWEGAEQSESLAEEDTVGYRYADPNLYSLLKNYALQNRAVPTQTEQVLWNVLKTKQLSAYKFRRQHIIDRFITDFVCLKKRLIIEVDGLIHQLPENKESDDQRTKVLNEIGFTVIRFTNNEVIFQLDTVIKKILIALEQSTAILQPILFEKIEVNNDAATGGGCASDGLPTGKVGMGRVIAVEPRTLHLGTDIWGPPYTKVMTPLNGIVHSFAFNNAFGDYGATIILTHNLDGEIFHTLYGHLSLNSIKNLHEGDAVYKGDVIAEFGIPFENGQWPPHLHFQIIKDMEGMKGDYPGVCGLGEKETYLANCPDADLLLGMMKYGR